MGAALGITKDLLDRAFALQQVGVDIVTLDSAHGHSKGVIDALKGLRKNFKNLQIIAGNVGTAEGALALAAAGDLYHKDRCRCRRSTANCYHGSEPGLESKRYSRDR